MKTFAHINANGDVVGIGMIYYKSGGLVEPVQQLVDDLGENAGIIAYGESVKYDPTLTTVVVDTAQMPGDDPDTYDKTFRAAYKHGGGLKVDIDIPKAKSVVHDMRREKRHAEFAPLDIEATIPSKAAAAEARRQKIRDDYDAIQISVDAAPDVTTLKAVIGAIKARQ